MLNKWKNKIIRGLKNLNEKEILSLLEVKIS